MNRQRVAVAIALALIALLLTSCVRPQQRLVADLANRATTPIEAMVRHLTPSWTTPFRPASRPVVTDGMVLAYESGSETQFDLVGLDAADGRERWRTPASPGAVAAGSELWITTGTVGGVTVVAHLGAPEAGRDTLVLADPRTGQPLHRLPVGTAGVIGTCRVSGGICVERIDGTRRTLLRVDPERVALAPLTLRQGPVDQIRNLGNGGYLIRRGSATFVGLDGELGRWEKPITDWLGADVDPATSWLDLQFDVTVSQLRVTARVAPLGATGFPVGQTTLASVNLSDGELLWSGTGRSWNCPGSSAPLACSGDQLEFTRTSRIGTGVRPGGSVVRYLGLDSGGEEVWRRDVAAPVAPLSGRLPVRTPGGIPVIGSNDRLISLDPQTGEPTTLTEEHWLACEIGRSFRLHQRADPTRPVIEFRATTNLPCSAGGTTTGEPAQFTVAGVLAVAATEPSDQRNPEVPGHYAVAMPEALALFR